MVGEHGCEETFWSVERWKKHSDAKPICELIMLETYRP